MVHLVKLVKQVSLDVQDKLDGLVTLESRADQEKMADLEKMENWVKLEELGVQVVQETLDQMDLLENQAGLVERAKVVIVDLLVAPADKELLEGRGKLERTARLDKLEEKEEQDNRV